MRDRHFVLWLIGLIIAPILLQKYSQYTSIIVYAAVGILAALGLAGLVWLGYKQWRESAEDQRRERVPRHLKISTR